MQYNHFALESAFLSRAFQLSTELLIKNSPWGCVKYNGGKIYNWARRKFISLQMPETIRNFSKSKNGQEVDIIYNSKDGYFCMKAVHLDSNVAGRIWTTEAEICVQSEKVLFGVKLSYSTPVNCNAECVDFSIPAFVREIFKNGIVDVRVLENKAWVIQSENDMNNLYDLVLSEKRQLPVIVISENSNGGNQIGNQYITGYLLDGDKLAEEIGYIAHIVKLPSELQKQWTDYVGRNWGVFNGAVRTYYPNLEFDDDSYTDHPIILPNRIMASNYEDDEREYFSGEAFEKILSGIIKRNNTSARIDWSSLGFKFYFIANRELMREREANNSNDIELCNLYKKQIESLERELEEKEKEVSTAVQMAEETEKHLGESREINYRLQLRIDSLLEQLEKTKEGSSEIPILSTYEELEEWINKYFPGRIYFHSRASKSLKQAVYADIELVYKSLVILGTSYYKMRTGFLTREEFDEECRKLGIEEKGSIVDSAAGELGDTYFVMHHGRKRKMDRHLVKGTSRDPRYCLRIYFFWDEDDSQVVVCSLPQHLDIAIS